MASQFVDPKKAKFPPEMYIEGVDQNPVNTGGQLVCSYVFDPKIVTIENIFFTIANPIDLFIAIDGVAEKEKLRVNALLPADYMKWEKFTAKKTIAIQAKVAAGLGPTFANQKLIFNLTARDPSIIEKLRFGIDLTDDEQKISDVLDLEDNLDVGTMSRPRSFVLPSDVYPLFDEVESIYVPMVALAANSDNVIGFTHYNPPGYVSVLLGIQVGTTIHGMVASDTFYVVDRDNDPGIMKVDTSAMLDRLTHPCYVPFMDRLICHITSVTGTAAVASTAGYIIGRRKATAIDYIKWGQNMTAYLSPSDEENLRKLIDKYTQKQDPNKNLVNLVKAGRI